MKKTSTLFCTLLLTTTAFAQIPNSGFESWTSAGSYSNPDNWGTINSLTAVASVYTCTEGSPGFAGNHYISLTSQTVPIIGVAPGVAVTGIFGGTPSAITISGGFPFTSRPKSLTGEWEYAPMGADQGNIVVYLWKWNMTTSKRDTIAFTDHALVGSATTWASFSFDLSYFSFANPDSALILLSSSGITSPVAGSYLNVDTLAFAGTGPSNAGVATVNNRVGATSLYPNPATGNTSITYYSNSSNTIKISVADLTGKIVREVLTRTTVGENIIPLNVQGIASGLYVVKIIDDHGTMERKLVIE